MDGQEMTTQQMTGEEIARVVALMESHGIAVFELETEGMHLKLGRNVSGGAATTIHSGETPASATRMDTPDAIVSPGVGWFTSTHAGTSATPQSFPRQVAKDEIVGFVRTGAALRPVLAPRAGVLGSPLLKEGAAVGYGAALFTFLP